jgi:uncharacterized protein (TIGR00288 family)
MTAVPAVPNDISQSAVPRYLVDTLRPWWLQPPAEEENPEPPAPAAEAPAPQGATTDAAEEGAAAPTGEAAEAEPAPGRRRRPTRRGGARRRRGAAKVEAAEAEEAPAPEPEPRRVVELGFLPTTLERTVPGNGAAERRIAMFCDLENIALGVRDSDMKKFDINMVLERLLEKGKIIVKKAYADWERYSDFKRPFHEAAIEMIDIPQKYYAGKNSADIKMAVDAIDLCYSRDHVDTFVILSGDSDFSPLVSKLRESNKQVIGVGVKNSSSSLLIDNCDEFIFYEDIWRDRHQKTPKLAGLNKKTSEAFALMIESIQALMRENKEVLWGSMIKETMKRKRPSFNEGYHGYSSFSELLEDAERQGILKLKRDARSGSYIVTSFAGGH